MLHVLIAVSTQVVFICHSMKPAGFGQGFEDVVSSLDPFSFIAEVMRSEVLLDSRDPWGIRATMDG